jgi:hypothetical protein
MSILCSNKCGNTKFNYKKYFLKQQNMSDYQLHEAAKKGDVVTAHSLIVYGGYDPNKIDNSGVCGIISIC